MTDATSADATAAGSCRPWSRFWAIPTTFGISDMSPAPPTTFHTESSGTPDMHLGAEHLIGHAPLGHLVGEGTEVLAER